ncbi:MAG: D-sedoheptulose 7-phosphate isomerase [Magnetococcales bacterium]|nr:D-sedoheptulose 7-phosphate isomerase [Magnetococcales bacterium]
MPSGPGAYRQRRGVGQGTSRSTGIRRFVRLCGASASREAALIDIERTIQEHQATVAALVPLAPRIQQLAEAMTRCLQAGGKILWMGNGGSAADSQHLAAELVGRFARERKGLPSIALTTDTSILTAVGNDYGYERLFSRQVEALCRPEDLVVGISTSGNSPNVVNALLQAREIGAFTAAFSGNAGGRLQEIADLCLTIPCRTTARIQEAHILIGHILCDWVEEAMMAGENHVHR